MITLDYQLSPSWRRSWTGTDFSAASTSDLRYSLFLGDVYFKVNEQDFSAPWGWVPVFDFALCVLQMARALTSPGCEVFEFTESDAKLVLERVGDEVRISSSYLDETAAVTYDELRNSVEIFTRRVLEELTDQFPALAANSAFRRKWKEVVEPDEASE